MKKFSPLFYGVIAIIICVLTFTVFNVKGETVAEKKRQILTVWQLDTFEGGVGSRTSFLKKICNAYSNKNENVLFLVSSHTPLSANELIKKGEYPDIISYGACGLDIVNIAREIKGFADINDGGVAIKKRYAVSWCRGNYFHIKRGNGGNLIISENEYNSALASATVNGIFKSEYKVYEPLTAYRNFLAYENAELIGTGRDLVRLNNRGISYTATPLKRYNDLFQYASVTSVSDERAEIAFSFLKYLLSKETQAKLTEINMLSCVTTGLYTDEYFSKAETLKFENTSFYYQTNNEITKIKQNATTFYNKGSSEDFIKSLKQL